VNAPRPPSVVRLRGHTLLCLQGFRGKGYSRAFTENLAAIHRSLTSNPEHLVQVLAEPDHVCSVCPHRAPGGCTLNGVDSEQDIQAQDRQVLELLGIDVGQVVPWREVLIRIRATITPADLPAICGQCRWLPLGYCAEGLEWLRRETASSVGPSPPRGSLL
jgi:hypothetical protein